MELEERVAALEAKFRTLETKRRALRSQFVALQFLLIELLPVIAATSTARVDAAIAGATRAAPDALSRAGFDATDIQDVRDALAVWRDELRCGAAAARGARTWH